MTDTPSIDAGPFEEVLAAIRFTADGLVPAIAQAEGSGEILMMAWMNRDAVVET